MALNRRQQQQAAQIMRIAARRGVPRSRLGELAFAAYKESGLNPASVNRSSGAAGLFQLLSSGYVNRANELGGVHNPKANLLAILPSYQKYWKEHPGAAPGAAARDVERSGMGAEWYAPTSDFVSQLGGVTNNPDRVTSSTMDIDPVGVASIDRSKLTADLLEMATNAAQTGKVDVTPVLQTVRDLNAEAMQKISDAIGQSGVPATGGVSGPGGTYGGILDTQLPSGSEFDTVDAEGAPGPGGKRYHAALDWFAPPGTTIRSPIQGMIVEVKQGETNVGQVFGGTVKVQGANGRVWVFRHVDPKNFKVGQKVRAGQPIAGVTDWQSGSDHTHIELWKTLAGGYNFGNMLDPLPVIQRLQGG